jgi:hypothetical protein
MDWFSEGVSIPESAQPRGTMKRFPPGRFSSLEAVYKCARRNPFETPPWEGIIILQSNCDDDFADGF